MGNAEPASVQYSTRRQLTTFVAIGAVNTFFYFATYNALRTVLQAYAANAIAVTASILFSFWANRRFTFQFAGSERGVGQLASFSTIFVMTLGVSSAALAVLFAKVDEPSVFQENLFLIGSSGALVLVRFWLMRRWVFTADHES